MRCARGVLAGLLGLFLAGCVSVPTTGPVEHHTPDQPAVTSGVEVAPLPPAQGASQLLVVEGFLHAMGAYDPGHRIAKEYLTEAAAKAWNPDSGVQVYADGSPPTETDQTVVLIAPLVGTIDATGAYRLTGGQLRQDFGLKNENGQWRISSPPDGLVVSRYLFSTSFDAVAVNFLSRSGDVLVPEPRYFASGEQAPADAAAAVVGGASPWLAPVVRKPVGSGVEVIGVTVDGFGAARVVLNAAAAVLSRTQRQALMIELTVTLSEFSQITSVEVSASGETWVDQNGATELNANAYSSYDPASSAAVHTLYVARGDKLQRQRDQSDFADYVDVQTDLPKAAALAVSTGNDWASVTDQRRRLVAGTLTTAKTRVLRTGNDLLRPGYARSGELWSPAGAGLAALRVYRGSTPIAVTQSDLPAGQVVALALSADGDRLAVVLDYRGTTTVGLVRVERSDAGIRLAGWRGIDLSLLGVTKTTLLDVGWRTSTDLAILRSDNAEQTSVIVVSEDGANLTDIGPSDSVGLRSVLAIPGRQAVALAAGGGLYRFDGEFDWLLSASDVDAAAYSG